MNHTRGFLLFSPPALLDASLDVLVDVSPDALVDVSPDALLDVLFDAEPHATSVVESAPTKSRDNNLKHTFYYFYYFIN